MILTPLRIFDCEIGSRIRLHLSKHRIVDYSGTPLINIYNPPPFFFLSVSDPIRTDLQPTSWELLCPFTIINFLCLSLCVVSGLSLGSGAEAEEGPLAGASHPAALYCIWQRAVWSSAAQPAPFHTSSPLWWRCLPHAQRCLPHVRLHWCPRGAVKFLI